MLASLFLDFPITSRERGNRRERVFFSDDAELYRDLLASQRRKQGVTMLDHPA